MTIEELREQLLMAPKNGLSRITADDRTAMELFAKEYMAFIDTCKTEREATAWTVAEAQKQGFKPFTPGMAIAAGDKIYFNNRDKSIILAVVGSESLAKGANICAAHIDSPRIDVKPNPVSVHSGAHCAPDPGNLAMMPIIRLSLVNSNQYQLGNSN